MAYTYGYNNSEDVRVDKVLLIWFFCGLYVHWKSCIMFKCMMGSILSNTKRKKLAELEGIMKPGAKYNNDWRNQTAYLLGSSQQPRQAASAARLQNEIDLENSRQASKRRELGRASWKPTELAGMGKATEYNRRFRIILTQEISSGHHASILYLNFGKAYGTL